MTRHDAGKYRAKHPSAAAPDPAMAAAVAEKTQNERLTCAAAFVVAERLAVAPSAVGTTADLLEYRIVACQLGLFGYSPEKRIVTPAEDVSDDLRDRLARGTVGGRISCAACWDVAQALGLSKLAVAGACEHLGLKIVSCQLGAF